LFPPWEQKVGLVSERSSLAPGRAAGFDVFVTADRSPEFQQTLSGRAFAVVVIFPLRVKMEYLLPLIPALLVALDEAGPGDVLHIHPPLRAG
jgi:hypothetical protein